MYLFHYQNARHRMNSYYRQECNLTTFRGQFDLEHIRSGLKKTGYTIYGHGTHPLHLMLNQLGLSEELIGHLIEVTDPKLAVWFKLNYDRVGRTGVKYVATYKAINDDDIASFIQRSKDLYSRYSTLTQERYVLSNELRSINSLLSFKEKSIATFPETWAKVADFSNVTSANLKNAETMLAQTGKDIEALKQEVKNYLQSHKLT